MHSILVQEFYSSSLEEEWQCRIQTLQESSMSHKVKELFLIKQDSTTVMYQPTIPTLCLPIQWIHDTLSKIQIPSQPISTNSNQPIQNDWKEEYMFVQITNQIIKPLARYYHHTSIPFLNKEDQLLLCNRNHNLYKQLVQYYNETDSYISTLFFITFLEYTLYNSIFITLHSTTTQQQVYFSNKPPKLHELLQSNEFVQLFGKELSSVLRTFMGPLHSLNVRNLLLHGFVTKNELPIDYLYFIYAIFHTIVPICRPLYINALQQQILFKPITIVPFLNASQIPCAKQLITNQLQELIEKSTLVLYSHVSLVSKALDYYHKGDDYSCLLLLFPVMEHSIRRIWTIANQCEDRLFTAESNSLYTTLDILLAPQIPSGYGIGENKLLPQMGSIICNALYDLFIWEEGNRWRDVLAHCNVLHEHVLPIPTHVSNFVVLLLCYLLQKYNHHHHIQVDTSLAIEYFEQVYEPMFHPKNQVERTMIKAQELYQQYYSNTVITIQDEIWKQLIPQVQLFFTSIFHTPTTTITTSSTMYSIELTEKQIKKLLLLKALTRDCIKLMQSIHSMIIQSNNNNTKINDRKMKIINRLLHSQHIFQSFLQYMLQQVLPCQYNTSTTDTDTTILNGLERILHSMVAACDPLQNKFQRAEEILLCSIFTSQQLNDDYHYQPCILSKSEQSKLFAQGVKVFVT